MAASLTRAAFAFVALSPFLTEPVFVFADIRPCVGSEDYETGTYGGYPVQTFFSDPDVIAPVPNVLVQPRDGVSPSRHMVWSPVGPKVEKMAARILDAHDLSMLYQGPSYDYETIGGTIQRCNDTDYLTWWSGIQHASHMEGRYYMMDQNYNLVFNFTAIGLDEGDAHEFHLTPQCTAVFTSYEPRPFDLSYWDPQLEEGFLLDSLFQEVDIATNTLLFQWRASDFISTTDTYIWPDISGQGHNIDQAFDFFHINSVQKNHLGNYLVSSRHTKALFYVSGTDGTVKWQLGGKHNNWTDVSDGTATDFEWQHHAEWVSEDLEMITLFDNAYCDYSQPDRPSRGMLIKLDHKLREVKLVQNYTALSNISAMREGSMQYLHDAPGNVIVGYGQEPGYTEFSPDGSVLHDVRFGPLKLNRDSADNYRALKVNWTGLPTWSPKIASGPPTRMGSMTDCPALPINSSWEPITEDNDIRRTLATDTNNREFSYDDTSSITKNTAYFSWNGATEIASWILLRSNISNSLDSTRDFWKRIPKDGFETSVRVAGVAMFVRAVAIMANDTILGATAVLDMRDGSTVAAPSIASSTVPEWKAIAAAEAAAHKWHPAARTTIFVVEAALLLAATFACWRMACKNWTAVSRFGYEQMEKWAGRMTRNRHYTYEGVALQNPDARDYDEEKEYAVHDSSRSCGSSPEDGPLQRR